MKSLLILSLVVGMMSGCVSMKKYEIMKNERNDWRRWYRESTDLWMDRALNCEETKR